MEKVVRFVGLEMKKYFLQSCFVAGLDMKGWIFSFQRQWTFKITHCSQSYNKNVSIMTKLDEGLKGNVFREKWRIHMVGGAMWDVIHLASIFSYRTNIFGKFFMS